MKIKFIALLGLTTLAMSLVGCGSDKAQIVQNDEAITSAKGLRSYFDESKGDFNALSSTDKAAAQKLAKGGPNEVQKMFDYMKTSNKTGTPGAQPAH